MAESVGSEYQEDVPDDSMFLFLEERSIKDPGSDDIEARRRSALDKNFMRFGRGGNDLYFSKNHLLNLDDQDYQDDFTRPARTLNKNDNFIRFGRGKAGDFIRFGRDPSYMRDVRGKDKNFIRFGRSIPVKRGKRHVNEFEEEKRHTNNMLRFGRTGNFMRFGRMPIYGNSNAEENQENQNNSSHVTSAKVFSHSYPSILPLLQQLAARLRLENKCVNCPRLG